MSRRRLKRWRRNSGGITSPDQGWMKISRLVSRLPEAF
jgi:hypothetical protein